jgi:transcription initiation factor TFIIH subunit 4
VLQIISYLTTRAHPQMKKQAATLPTTVVDQIRLWEREGQRVQSSEGYLYDDFTTLDDFRLVRDYAARLDVVLWENEEVRKCVVTGDGHLQIRSVGRERYRMLVGVRVAVLTLGVWGCREFIKRRMQAAAAGAQA